jgi:hypothetical protein
MKKFFKNILIFLVAVLLIGNSIAWLANYFLAKSYFYKPNFISNHLPPNSHFDYVLAGSSRGLTTVNTVAVDEKLGMKGLNLSMDDTGLPSHFLMIQHYFESGNTADFCVLTVDAGYLEGSKQRISDKDYRFISYSDRPYVHDYYKAYERGIIRPLTLSAYLPIVAFSYYNIELLWPAAFAMLRPQYTNRFDLNGNYSYPEAQVAENDPNLKWEILEKYANNPDIKELEAYLKTKNCKLIIYIAPYLGTEIAVKAPLDYPLINHSAALKTPNFFYDKDHVNNQGKQKATELFADAFQEILETL